MGVRVCWFEEYGLCGLSEKGEYQIPFCAVAERQVNSNEIVISTTVFFWISIAEHVYMLYMRVMGQEGKEDIVLNLCCASPLVVRMPMTCEESERSRRDNQRVCNLTDLFEKNVTSREGTRLRRGTEEDWYTTENGVGLATQAFAKLRMNIPPSP